MKKHISILKLAAANSFYKILAVTGLTLILEFILFAVSAMRFSDPALEAVFTGSGIPLGAGIGAAVIFVMLYMPWTNEKGSRPLITLRQLRIKDSAAAAWIALYNFCVFVVFWALQLFAVLLMSRVFLNTTGTDGQAQIIFLAFYRTGFLHSLLPLSDIMRLIRTIMDIILLSVSALLPCFSGDAVFSRRAAKSYLTGLSLAVVLGSWCETGGYFSAELIDIGCSLLLICLCIAQIAVSCRYKDEPTENELKRLEKREAKALKKKGALL